MCRGVEIYWAIMVSSWEESHFFPRMRILSQGDEGDEQKTHLKKVIKLTTKMDCTVLNSTLHYSR